MTLDKRLFSFPVILLAMVLAICLVMIGYNAWRINRFAPYIKAASFGEGLDPLLVKAIIKRESDFDPLARGEAGELGLMQVTPAVAREYAEHKGMKEFPPERLLEPALNLKVGCWYLARAIKRYRGFPDPVPFALAQYNAGASNVERWLAATKQRGNTREFMRAITYPGTRDYVRSVMRRWRWYRIFSL